MHQDPSLDDQSPNHIILMGHHNPIVLQPMSPTQGGGNDTVDNSLIRQPVESEFKMEVWWSADDLESASAKLEGSLELINSDGNHYTATYMLDTGFNPSFIRQTTVQSLQLEPHPLPTEDIKEWTTVSGVSGSILTYVIARISAVNKVALQRSCKLLIIPERLQEPPDIDVIIGAQDIIKGDLLGPPVRLILEDVKDRVGGDRREVQSSKSLQWTLIHRIYNRRRESASQTINHAH